MSKSFQAYGSIVKPFKPAQTRYAPLAFLQPMLRLLHEFDSSHTGDEPGEPRPVGFSTQLAVAEML